MISSNLGWEGKGMAIVSIVGQLGDVAALVGECWWLADDTQPIAVERAIELVRILVSKNLVDCGRGERTLFRAGQHIFFD